MDVKPKRKRKNNRKNKKRIKETVREKIEKLEIERIERIKERDKIEIEIEKITTQILNKGCIKNLTKNWNIESRKESKQFILNAAITISNGKNTKVEPINSTLKTK